MTEKVNNEEFRPISWKEVQAGDVLVHESGSILFIDETHEAHSGDLISMLTPAGSWTQRGCENSGFSPYRRVPDLPSRPGAYQDKAGGLWELDANGLWYGAGGERAYTEYEITLYAPFTRLVPMPTEEQVQKAVWDSTEETFTNDKVNRIVTAVMALFEQEVES